MIDMFNDFVFFIQPKNDPPTSVQAPPYINDPFVRKVSDEFPSTLQTKEIRSGAPGFHGSEGDQV